jgi:hypothetical protein
MISLPRILNKLDPFLQSNSWKYAKSIVGLRQLHLCVGQQEHYYSEHMTTNDSPVVMSSDVMSLRHPGITTTVKIA